MILYDSNENKFDTNGIGLLSDAVECMVTEEKNGSFELRMKYPVDSAMFNELKLRRIIFAKPASNRTEQAFRIYRITKPINKIVDVYAQHISYDLSGYIVEPFTADSASTALDHLKNTIPANPFNFSTDVDTKATMKTDVPQSSRSLLGGSMGSVLDVYGGDYTFDNFNVRLESHRGADNGVSIRYGKNLTDLKQDENCNNVVTAIYPFWSDYQGGVVALPEKTVSTGGTYNFDKVKVVDFTANFEEKPTEDKLRAEAKAYITRNNLGKPKVSLKVKFVNLDQTEEYKDIALLERVNLGDTVQVEFPELNVSSKARCVKTVYNVLLDRMESIELGESRANIADSIAENSKKPTAEENKSISQALTNALLGANGGAVRFLDTNNDGQPDTLYIADNADPAKAVKVWRFNYEGWGASKTGYNGPYILGADFEHGLIANFITAGILQSINGKTKINLDTGNCDIYGNIETISSNEGIKTHVDSGGLWRQRANGDRRGIYTSTGDEIIANVDRLHISEHSDTQVWGKSRIILDVTDDGNATARVLNGNKSFELGLDVTHTYSCFFIDGNAVLWREVRGVNHAVLGALNGYDIAWTYDSRLGKYVLTGKLPK